jgi:rubrerythrin
MDKTQKAIRKALHEEKEAVNDYLSGARVVSKAGDKPTAKLFRHIAKDERHHRSELKKRLKRVK